MARSLSKKLSKACGKEFCVKCGSFKKYVCTRSSLYFSLTNIVASAWFEIISFLLARANIIAFFYMKVPDVIRSNK